MKMGEIDFLIIGATKSATTWLQRSLQADPAVYMPDPELHYFSREFGRGDAWYLRQFTPPEADRVIGEKSNSYLEDESAAERIERQLPGAKLVAQLRNPLDRAYSDYCMMYRRGEVGRDVARYLDPARSRETRFLDLGLYHRQLKAYFDRFPPEQIFVTFFEAIQSRPDSHLAAVREFLSLANDVPAAIAQRKVKDKATPMLGPTLRRMLGPVKPIAAPFRNSFLFRKLHSTLAAEIRYSPFPEAVRDRLIDYYARDVEALGRLIGRDLSEWLRAGFAPAAEGALGGQPVLQRSSGAKPASSAGFT